MLDAALVDQRVAGDAAGDRHAEREPPGIRMPQPADKDDSHHNQRDGGNLPGARAVAESEHGDA